MATIIYPSRMTLDRNMRTLKEETESEQGFRWRLFHSYHPDARIIAKGNIFENVKAMW